MIRIGIIFAVAISRAADGGLGRKNSVGAGKWDCIWRMDRLTGNVGLARRSQAGALPPRLETMATAPGGSRRGWQRAVMGPVARSPKLNWKVRLSGLGIIMKFSPRILRLAAGLFLAGWLGHADSVQADEMRGWLHWRGPNQNGTSEEKNLPEKVQTDQALWTADLGGMSTPVIANGKLYILGVKGEGPDLQEAIACFEAESGKQLWEHRFNDFLSDIIYTRYATANPTVDPATGNVYMQGSQGIFACFSPDGKLLWQQSMMELYGRMTFPNGRTSTPVVDKDIVFTHGITANWGANGPASDRFYAFDTRTGELVWSSTPAARPKDSSYAPPTLSWWNGQRVFYCGTGDGSVVCVNARNGKPIWRTWITQGGVNTQVLTHNNDKLIVIHGSENIDNSEIGRMIALRIPKQLPAAATEEPVVFPVEELELWRNGLSAFTSSPILVGDRVYQVAETGDLCAVDAKSGKILWKKKIGIEQRNASLVHADGKLYVPMLEDPAVKGKGAFYILKPGDDGAEVLSHIQLDGRCFGSPLVYNGKIYLQTTQRVYCFGKKGDNPGLGAPPQPEPWPQAGKPAELQPIPAEVLLHPGGKQAFRVRKLDANGFTVEETADPGALKWASYIPPTAKVKAQMNASFNDQGELVAEEKPEPSAGAFEATLGDLKGYIRGRVLPGLPMSADFQEFELNETHATEGVKFAYPPLPWIGARFKFEVRDREGNNVLTKTIDNKLFQRATVFIGHPDMKNYTVEADVMSDGSRRKMSEVGLINQRYHIVIKGNYQELEVNSNLERLKVAVPFRWVPNAWYRLKTRVEVAPDGSGVVRAKAWKKGEPEPEPWTIEVPHKTAHASGSPGLFGFSPQEMRVYIDNVSVTQN